MITATSNIQDEQRIDELDAYYNELQAVRGALALVAKSLSRAPLLPKPDLEVLSACVLDLGYWESRIADVMTDIGFERAKTGLDGE